MKEHYDPLEVNPCKEVELAWRHERVEYIVKLFKDLPSKEQRKFLEEIREYL